MFVELEFQQFQSCLNRPLHVSEHLDDGELKKLTTIEVIDLVVYGSGLFHRQSRDGLEPIVAALISNAPREKILFAFHACCREVIKHAFVVRPVIKQDFDHWIDAENCVGLLELAFRICLMTYRKRSCLQ